MKIAYFLNKGNNNLDLIRIILAGTVIFGHTIAINGDTRYWEDPVKHFFLITYSGAAAVKLFFFISGLVVTNSYINNDSLIYFVISRLFRILPALLFLLLITVFIVGPIFTNISLNEYFSSLNHFSYIRRNMIFNTEYKLPGLFNKNLYNSAINGSLWSLHYEIECYFFLMCSFLLFRNKKLILNIIFGIILIDTILPSRMIFHALGSSPEIYYLPFSFAYGVFLAVNQTEIRINRMLVIFSFLTCFIFRNTGYQELFLIIASCNLIVFVASRKFVLGIKPKYDISYGIYLWGFLIQQVVYFTLGQVYAGLHFAIALILSVIIAYISFVFVEKPFMNLGKQAIRFCKLKNDDFLKKYSFRINS